MPISKPLKLCTYRMDEDEKRRLQQLAAERNITLSFAIREGLKLYLEDWRRDGDQVSEHVAAT